MLAQRDAIGARVPFRTLARDRRGVVSIEFALVIGVLIAIVIGTIEVGRALSVRSEMSHALGRVTRLVNLDSTMSEEEIVDRLELYLADYDVAELEVEIMEVSGTDFMEVAVRMPHSISVPFLPVSNVTLRVASRAPMVSPTQAGD
jgi:Flp pilus assembly pilin Flp